jgi:hypothetical protein
LPRVPPSPVAPEIAPGTEQPCSSSGSQA